MLLSFGGPRISKKIRRLVNVTDFVAEDPCQGSESCCVADGDFSVIGVIGSNNSTQIAELVCEMNVTQYRCLEWVGKDAVRGIR